MSRYCKYLLSFFECHKKSASPTEKPLVDPKPEETIRWSFEEFDEKPSSHNDKATPDTAEGQPLDASEPGYSIDDWWGIGDI